MAVGTGDEDEEVGTATLPLEAPLSGDPAPNEEMRAQLHWENSFCNSQTSLTAPTSLCKVKCSSFPSSCDLTASKDASWDMSEGALTFEKVQSDPFASPSLVSFRVSQNVAGFPEWCFSSVPRQVATEDFLCRIFYQFVKSEGAVHIQRPSQIIIQRNSVLLDAKELQVRFSVQLPASNGRRIYGEQAKTTMEGAVLAALKAMRFANVDQSALKRHIEGFLDQIQLRSLMEQEGIVSFVANGSILPRAGGDTDQPLSGVKAVPFESPPSLLVRPPSCRIHCQVTD